MASGAERSPREKETLIFKTPEEAAAFRENVRERMDEMATPGVKRDREAVGEMVGEQLARHGEVSEMLNTPWEHSGDEHEEAQKLVDMAFKEDLQVAIRQAQSSSYYPRILDLLHDVLTGQVYEVIAQKEVNRAKPNKLIIAGVVGVGVLVILALLVLGI